MIKLKTLVSSKNVDSIYVNGEYQDETEPLFLDESDIKHYQCSINIVTKDNKKISINFHSAKEMHDFVKAYGLE